MSVNAESTVNKFGWIVAGIKPAVTVPLPQGPLRFPAQHVNPGGLLEPGMRVLVKSVEGGVLIVEPNSAPPVRPVSVGNQNIPVDAITPNEV